jgi:hypothetical protein
MQNTQIRKSEEYSLMEMLILHNIDNYVKKFHSY